MSGVDIDGLSIRKGASDSIISYIQKQGKTVPADLSQIVDGIAKSGGTPLVVARNGEAVE